MSSLPSWRDGLRSSPGPGAQLFRGSELARFHLERKVRSKASLRHGEFKCLHCKAVVVPEPGDLELWPRESGGCMVFVTCPDCDRRTARIVSETECNKLRIACDANTSLYHIVKEAGPIPDGIGRIAPHSARHCMTAEMDRWPLTTEQRKALSANLGQESMTTTEAHYGKLNDAQRFEAMEGIADRQKGMTGEDAAIRALAYSLHHIDEDHPDSEMAKAEFQNLRAKTQMRYQFGKTGEEPRHRQPRIGEPSKDAMGGKRTFSADTF